MRYTQKAGRSITSATLLLVAASTSLVSTHQAAAQPPRVATSLPRVPFSMDDEASRAKALNLTLQEERIKTAISLKVEDVSLQQLVAQIQRVLPEVKDVQIRGASPVRLSFELKDVLAGQALSAAAALAGCELHLYSDRFVIAPLSTLTEAENKERFPWMPGPKLYSESTIRRMYVQTLAKSIQARAVAAGQTGGAGEALVGELEPELQRMVEHLARWSRRGLSADVPPAIIAQDTKVSVSQGPNRLDLDVKQSKKSDPKAKTFGFGYTFINGDPVRVKR